MSFSWVSLALIIKELRFYTFDTPQKLCVFQFSFQNNVKHTKIIINIEYENGEFVSKNVPRNVNDRGHVYVFKNYTCNNRCNNSSMCSKEVKDE